MGFYYDMPSVYSIEDYSTFTFDQKACKKWCSSIKLLKVERASLSKYNIYAKLY